MDKYQVFTVALPDTDQAAGIARRLSSVADQRFDHASGRPWLFTRQLTNQSVTHIDTPTPIAVVGSADITPDRLVRLAADACEVEDLSLISRDVAGSFTVFGSADGTLYANAPALQSKRLFHSFIDGVRVIADRADVLADLGDFPINQTKLGLRMIRGLPHPADEIQVWDSIDALPGWEYITVNRNGIDYDTQRWWHRPAPTLGRRDAAMGLRDALDRSVRARAANHPSITCDLSGGLDSTPICYFASAHTDNAYAHTYYTNDPGGREDLDWARRAMAGMPRIKQHQVFSNENMPDFYEDLTGVIVPMDLPSAAAGTVPRLSHMLGRDRSLGNTMHLNGIGGDHLLRGVKLWNHTIARRRPLTGWRRARAEDIPDGVGRLRTLRELADRRPYSDWFRRIVDRAFSHQNKSEMPSASDWSVPISVPDWLTPQFADAAQSMLREIAADADPLDETHAGHFDIQTVLHATALTRAMEQAGHHLGVAYEAPLLDDHVVNAVLAARHEERDTPIEWKPLMKEAMTGLLPNDYLRRTSKIGGSPQSVRGFSDHYDELTKLWNNSGLFDYGIVDVDTMRGATRPSTTAMPPEHISTQNNVALFLACVNQ